MPKKILIIKLWAMGEVMLSTPCISELRAKFPDAILYFLVGDSAKDAVIGNPHIDKVLLIDEEIFLKPDWLSLLRLIRDLRNERFDLVIILHYAVLFSLFAFLTGAPERWGLKRKGRLSLNTRDIVSSTIAKPRVFDYLMAAGSSSVLSDYGNIELRLYPTDEDGKNMALLMKENGVTAKDFIVIAPTGGQNPAASRFHRNIMNKTWPVEYYKDLCRLIVNNLGYKVVIVGSKNEKYRAHYISSLKNEKIIDFTGRTNLRELKVLAEKAVLAVTNDSGPMFVLSSAGLPVISVFGPTNPDLVCYGLNNIIVMNSKLDCSPCSYDSVSQDKIRICRNPVCMEDITPEKVFQKICEVLKI